MATILDKELKDSLESFATGSFSRRSGNSTRLIDHTIQLLFSGYRVIVKDHYEGGESFALNLRLYKKIIKRIQMEHLHLLENHKLVSTNDNDQIEMEILD